MVDAKRRVQPRRHDRPCRRRAQDRVAVVQKSVDPGLFAVPPERRAHEQGPIAAGSLGLHVGGIPGTHLAGQRANAARRLSFGLQNARLERDLGADYGLPQPFAEGSRRRYLRVHARRLGVVAGGGPQPGHGAVIRSAEHHAGSAFGQGDQEIVRVGEAVGVSNHHADIVKRHPRHLLARVLDHHEAPLHRQVAAVLGDLYNPFDHSGGPGSRTRPRISTDTLRVPRFLSWLNETRI